MASAISRKGCPRRRRRAGVIRRAPSRPPVDKGAPRRACARRASGWPRRRRRRRSRSVAGDRDQRRDEAVVIERAVHGRREADRPTSARRVRRAQSPCSRRRSVAPPRITSRSVPGRSGDAAEGSISVPEVLRTACRSPRAPRRSPGPRAGRRRSRRESRRERMVVLKREVDDAVGGRGRVREAVEVVEVAAAHLGACGFQTGGGAVRAGEARRPDGRRRADRGRRRNRCVRTRR